MSVVFNKETNTISRSDVTASYPDNLNLYQFMFEYRGSHDKDGKPIERLAPEGCVWMIDEKSGAELHYEYIYNRVLGLAKGLRKRGFRANDVVSIFSPNNVDYPIAIWAAFRLEGIVTCANPAYSSTELLHQINVVNASYPLKAIFIHPSFIATALDAVQQAGLDPSSLILLDEPPSDLPLVHQFACQALPTIEDIIHEGMNESLPKLNPLRAGEAFEKIAFLSFSSGTTGLPKAVMVSHGNVIANIYQIGRSNGIFETPYNPKDPKAYHDVSMAVLPFFHIYGLVVCLHASIFNNIPIVPVAVFSLEPYLQATVKYQATMLWLVPPIVLLLAKHPTVKNYDLSHVRMIVSGAAPLGEDVIKIFEKSHPHIKLGQGYGMTESAVVVAVQNFTYPKVKYSASAGQIVADVEAKIMSGDGQPQGINGVGELWVKAPSITLGYLGNAEATEETYTKDGFLRTGDECTINDEGFLFILDRIKELIKVKGNQVAPAELESLIAGLDYVDDVAVCGIPDDFSGELPLAAVVLRADAKNNDLKVIERDIRDHVISNKIKYKHLGHVIFVDSIPKNASGKILRRVIKQEFLDKLKESKPKI